MDSNERKTRETVAATEGLAPTERTRERRSLRRVVAHLGSFAVGVLYALAGYLLGGATLLFGARPLGIALLSATDRKSPARCGWCGKP